MSWIRSHPYASALSVAAVLVLIGAYIVERQAAGPIRSGATAWGGAGAPLLNPTSYSPQPNTPPNQENIMQNVKKAPPYTYIPPSPPTNPTSSTEGDNFDFDAFVAMLAASGGQKTTKTSGDTSATTAYSFIPRGLMSTSTSEHPRTEMQQTLYNYGNEIGSFIQSFEQQHPGVAQTLKNQVEDRGNAEKAAAVVQIADALKNVGENLNTMDNVPSQMASVHARLAKSYIAIGTNLAKVPATGNDSDFLKAIEAYNTVADTFVKNYVAMAELFGAYGVIFTLTDAGSVFTFTPSGF